jgi:hypothetical protein
VNTQNKVDIKYGKVEVRAKLPKGQGIWPAIWMMPTNDKLYGGWPKCGEIDIMELLGNNPNKVYQTLHYSKNGSDVQSQATKILSKGDFSSDYHVFSVEWDPGKISFFVDGKLTKTFTKWYTGTDGLGIITYPAPFDQSFYMILNIAVGGSWPGNPDATTDFAKTKMMVDYVKVYQKASYNENVTMEEGSSVTLRNPDANGNYINNSDFSETEKLNDTTGWYLQTAMGGDAAGTISDHTMTITTKAEGTVDYAIQAMQAGIPLAKGGHYRISFDAKAEADRSMVLRLDGPNLNYLKYMKDQMVNLTTAYKTYTYDFTMSDDTDENGRFEFNLGAQNSTNPTATVQVKNVKLACYTILGALCGLSGAMYTSVYASSQGNMATGIEMDAIAACVVGGVSLTGGRGSVVGVFLGTLIISIIGKGLPLIGVSQFWQKAIKGLIILIAVIINVLVQRQMNKAALKRREI